MAHSVPRSIQQGTYKHHTTDIKKRAAPVFGHAEFRRHSVDMTRVCFSGGPGFIVGFGTYSCIACV